MKADYIKEVINQYTKLPYKCILFDGPWGIGKSYAIDQVLNDNKNVCNISMFGIKDAQKIYHEVFFQLILKDKSKIGKKISHVLDAGAEILEKLKTTKRVISSLVREKELFLEITKSFNDYNFIVIDDLERMNDSIELEEVFGIIEELKRCNYVKVILVANTAGISEIDTFKKYSEKVIDRIYHINERPEDVDWVKLKIHDGFITQFLKVHDVKNLRTLQKAQNFYDDVELKLKDGYISAFRDEIRIACFGVVVEPIDNLYYKEPEKEKNDPVMQAMQNTCNMLEHRVSSYYLQGTRISRSMVELLKKYYENEIELLEDEIEAEYQVFIQAGEKANFYKSDEELKRVLPCLADNIRKETNIIKLLRYADEYIIWSEHLQISTKETLNDYKKKLHDLIYTEALNGDIGHLTYGLESYYLQSQTNKEIVKELNEIIKKEVVKAYIEYLASNTEGEQAYKYSYSLRDFVDNSHFRDNITGNVDALYNEKSFPICSVTEETYRISQNIMYVLYQENKNRLLTYCDELKNKCDNMASHRISVIIKDLTENEH